MSTTTNNNKKKKNHFVGVCKLKCPVVLKWTPGHQYCLASLAHALLACHTRLHDESKECLQGERGGGLILSLVMIVIPTKFQILSLRNNFSLGKKQKHLFQICGKLIVIYSLVTNSWTPHLAEFLQHYCSFKKVALTETRKDNKGLHDCNTNLPHRLN